MTFLLTVIKSNWLLTILDCLYFIYATDTYFGITFNLCVPLNNK